MSNWHEKANVGLRRRIILDADSPAQLRSHNLALVQTDTQSNTVLAPSSPTKGMVFTVADKDGNASEYPITVDFGAQQMKVGATAYDDMTITTNNMSIQFMFDGSYWRAFA